MAEACIAEAAENMQACRTQDGGVEGLGHVGPAELLARLDKLGIAHETHTHEAVFTVAEAAHICAVIPGGHCRTLFLKGKKGGLYLVSALDRTEINLKALGKVLGSGSLSFGSAELLHEILGVYPGSVTPFALINDTSQRLCMIMDAALCGMDQVNFHPLVNTMTSTVHYDGLVRFIEACGHSPQVMDFTALANGA